MQASGYTRQQAIAVELAVDGSDEMLTTSETTLLVAALCTLAASLLSFASL